MTAIAETTFALDEVNVIEHIPFTVTYDGEEFTLLVFDEVVATGPGTEWFDTTAITIAVTEYLINDGAFDAAVCDAVDTVLDDYIDEDELVEEFAELNEEEEAK